MFSCSDCEKKKLPNRSRIKKTIPTVHKPQAAKNVKRPPLQAAAAANIFLDVPAHHRSARLKELLKLLPREEFSRVVLYVYQHVSTSSISTFKKQTYTRYCFRKQVTRRVGSPCCDGGRVLPRLTSLFLKTAVSFFPFYNHDIKVYTRVTTQAKCGEWINFIDDLNIPQDQQQKAQLVDFVISHKNGEFLKARSCLSFLRKNSIILSSLWLHL